MQKNVERDVSSVQTAIAWLAENLPEGGSLQQAAREYVQNVETEQEGSPFLTVVTRTQGKRNDMLQEMLLCLMGQTDSDFEVLLMGHNMTPQQQADVEALIQRQPASLRQKIRLIPVTGGTRSTPLNVGFREAKGCYIAALDDDDLVFDNWVESFHTLAREKPGKLLHCYSVFQIWDVTQTDAGMLLRSIGPYNTLYCEKFNFTRQMEVNRCPLMSVAFPAKAFHEYGIHFDEALNTTEDWDFLMRTAFLVGVADSENVTSIYRIWENTERSTTLYSQEEWEDTRQKIMSKYKAHPLFLWGRDLLKENNGDIHSFDHTYNEAHACISYLYFSGNGEFEEDNKLERQPSKESDEGFCYTFEGKGLLKDVTHIRIDPDGYGGLVIGDLKIKVDFENGSSKYFGHTDVRSNGYSLGDRFVFIKTDPQIILSFQEPCSVEAVHVGFSVSWEITEEIMMKTVYRFDIPRRVLFTAKKLFHTVCEKLFHG